MPQFRRFKMLHNGNKSLDFSTLSLRTLKLSSISSALPLFNWGETLVSKKGARKISRENVLCEGKYSRTLFTLATKCQICEYLKTGWHDFCCSHRNSSHLLITCIGRSLLFLWTDLNHVILTCHHHQVDFLRTGDADCNQVKNDVCKFMKLSLATIHQIRGVPPNDTAPN